VIFGRARSARADRFESEALPHLDDLYRTAARTTGSRSEAEDLVQETFLQAWKSFHRFEPGTNCRAWLFKILFHVIHHHRRKWYVSRATFSGDDLLEDTVIYRPPIPEEIRDEDVLRALERIPPKYKEVVLLADVEDFAYKEIAEALNIPIGTVMSRLSRGRNLLRAELKSFAQSYGLRLKGMRA
jgi:RNA polymerase sigma-70 factor (ECF subfamily)